MSRIIVLDSGSLGLATNPGGSKEAAACGRWLLNAATGGAMVMVPEIADYEVRRELLRARRTAGIARLDALITQVEYLAITTSAMRQAATFWAEARQQDRPTAAGPALPWLTFLSAAAPNIVTVLMCPVRPNRRFSIIRGLLAVCP